MKARVASCRRKLCAWERDLWRWRSHVLIEIENRWFLTLDFFPMELWVWHHSSHLAYKISLASGSSMTIAPLLSVCMYVRVLVHVCASQQIRQLLVRWSADRHRLGTRKHDAPFPGREYWVSRVAYVYDFLCLCILRWRLTPLWRWSIYTLVILFVKKINKGA